LYGGVNQYARLLGLFAMQGNTHFKNKIKTFNAYTLPKVHISWQSVMAFNNAEPMLKRLKTATLIRHFRPVKKRAKAKKALTRLRTIAKIGDFFLNLRSTPFYIYIHLLLF
jgi:hypothetical protein